MTHSKYRGVAMKSNVFMSIIKIFIIVIIFFVISFFVILHINTEPEFEPGTKYNDPNAQVYITVDENGALKGYIDTEHSKIPIGMYTKDGKIHLWLEPENEEECFFIVADYHLSFKKKKIIINNIKHVECADIDIDFDPKEIILVKENNM